MSNVRENPLVSVIIPTYNRADLLVRAVQSAAQQTYTNLEIIIVDDASTENIDSVVETFDDHRISYLRHDANYGASTTRNSGIKVAKGDYLAFLDSDDDWVANKVELQMSELLACTDPENTVCYSQVIVDCGSAGSYIMPDHSRCEANSLASYLFGGGLIHTSSLLLSRSLANSTMFREDLIIHEDWDLFFRLEKKGISWLFVKTPLATWHNDPRVDRLSVSEPYQLSLDWFEDNSHFFTEKERVSFLATNVIHTLINNRVRKFFAEKIIIDAVFHRVIPIREGVRMTVRVFVPKGIRKKIKSFLK